MLSLHEQAGHWMRYAQLSPAMLLMDLDLSGEYSAWNDPASVKAGLASVSLLDGFSGGCEPRVTLGLTRTLGISLSKHLWG